MRRRQLVLLLGALIVSASSSGWVAGQQPGNVPRIGYLSPASASAGLSARDKAFLQGLREHGYVEGKNVVIEYRFAEGQFDRLPALAAELAEMQVDVIAAVVTQASLAAKDATPTIPIVMLAVSDPVESGLVASVARPGGNVTGTSSMNAEVAGKSLELLKEAVPGISNVAVVWNPDNAVFQAQMLEATEVAAASLGIRVEAFGVQGPEQFETVFATIAESRADGLLILADPTLILHQAKLADLVGRSGLPAVYGTTGFAVDAGLMAYGPRMEDQFRRAAVHVDKILKGAKPADLPVEQPVSFELIINLKSAKALGIEIPPSLLIRADEVIE